MTEIRLTHFEARLIKDILYNKIDEMISTNNYDDKMATIFQNLIWKVED